MNCLTLRPLLSRRLDDELAPAERDRVDHHLLGCAACRVAAERLAEASARFAVLREARAPATLRERLVRTAAHSHPAPHPLAIRAAAAMLGAALYLTAAWLVGAGAARPRQAVLEVATPSATREQALRIEHHLSDAAQLLGGPAHGDSATLGDSPEARLLAHLIHARETR